ncbi:hypothetical protein D3C83_57230 [compost metagenome]
MAHGAGLTGLATAVDVDADVESNQIFRQYQRLAHDHATGLPREELIHRFAVDDDIALARPQEHTRHCALAPARAIVLLNRH